MSEESQKARAEAAEGIEAEQRESTEQERPELKRVVEALLFSSDRPVSTGRIAQLCDAEDGHEVRSIIGELQREYAEEGHAFRVEEIAGGFQVLTHPRYAPWVSRLHTSQQQESLSQAALETLAIVAYRQPVTRAEVEDIRGVHCGHMLRSLVDKRLIKVTGRADELGRPMLYGTTRHFMEAFGLRSLKDLPRREKLVQPPAPSSPASAGDKPDAEEGSAPPTE